MRLEHRCQRFPYTTLFRSPEGMPLAPGVTVEQFAAFEAALGQTLPADVRESYLLHNGTGDQFLLYFGTVEAHACNDQSWKELVEWHRNDNWSADDAWQPDE